MQIFLDNFHSELPVGNIRIIIIKTLCRLEVRSSEAIMVFKYFIKNSNVLGGSEADPLNTIDFLYPFQKFSALNFNLSSKCRDP